MSEIGTLKELNLKTGDVVECVSCPAFGGEWTVGNIYKMTDQGLSSDRNGPQRSSVTKFRIISRASDTPKLWSDMTDAEKGALLLAHHEGKVIEGRNETWTDEDWLTISHPSWHNNSAYRIRPEPKIEEVTLYVKPNKNGIWIGTDSYHSSYINKVTFRTVDGKPDQSSIKMGEA